MKVGEFLKRNETLIQVLFLLVNTAIAAVMLCSISISKRQLEASVEPRLELTQSYKMDVHAPPTETNEMSGVAITNVLSFGRFTKTQMDDFRRSMTNTTIVTFKNVGAVDISDVELIMRLKVAEDENGTVTNAVYGSFSQSLAHKLRQNQSVEYDFGQEDYLTRLVELHQPGNHIVCYVVRYRRSVDMKPKYSLVCFEAANTPAGEIAFLITHLSESYFPGGFMPAGIGIEGLTKFLQKLNVLPASGD